MEMKKEILFLQGIIKKNLKKSDHMKKSFFNARFGTLCLIVLTAGILRLIPLPYNFAPIGAMALFGGAYFGKRWQSFLIPLAALFISDIVVNYAFYGSFVIFHSMVLWVYGAFALNVIIGSIMIKSVKVSSVITASITASVLFFVITNFGVWASTGLMSMYPHNAAGLGACYLAGLPYFWRTLAGDLFFTSVMFGVFELAQRRFPVLATEKV
jgi:hypothetical protein